MSREYTTQFDNFLPYTHMVQPDLRDTTDYYTARTTLVAAGDPRLPDDGTFPDIRGLGLLETASLVQNLGLTTIFEIGSDFMIDVPGRNMPSITVGRLFTYQPNLLALLYNYYWADDEGTDVDISKVRPVGDIEVSPNVGSGVWLNLGAYLFKYPFGMMILFAKDADIGEDVDLDVESNFYLENCHITGHQLGINSGAIVLMESCAIKPARVVPVDVNTGT